jgi:hypothetical protein
MTSKFETTINLYDLKKFVEETVAKELEKTQNNKLDKENNSNNINVSSNDDKINVNVKNDCEN